MTLDTDLDSMNRYIEFHEDNFSAYSNELVRLFLASSSEVDVVLKALCSSICPKGRHRNIYHYKKTIKKKEPDLINQKVFSPQYNLMLEPWKSWMNDKNPKWWKSYNKVKHKRNSFFKEANLENVLNSIAALFIVNIYYYLEKIQAANPDYPYDLSYIADSIKPHSKIFNCGTQMGFF